ncbi:MAG: hypothetical protein LBL41_04325 [Bifidobacteriaceae bacterium]|jgi:hypothetical protein|nr:hypothetical protein [Bifidobacteriaceae bacterium]
MSNGEINIDIEASKKRSLANGITEAEFNEAIKLNNLEKESVGEVINAIKNGLENERILASEAMKKAATELNAYFGKGLVFVHEYPDASFIYDEYNDYLHDR